MCADALNVKKSPYINVDNRTGQGKSLPCPKGVPHGKASLFRRWDHRREHQYAGGSRIHGGGIGGDWGKVSRAGRNGD